MKTSFIMNLQIVTQKNIKNNFINFINTFKVKNLIKLSIQNVGNKYQSSSYIYSQINNL